MSRRALRTSVASADEESRGRQASADHLNRPVAGGSALQVIEDLQKDIPITGPELEVIETYLGNLLGGIFGTDEKKEAKCDVQ